MARGELAQRRRVLARDDAAIDQLGQATHPAEALGLREPLGQGAKRSDPARPEALDDGDRPALRVIAELRLAPLAVVGVDLHEQGEGLRVGGLGQQQLHHRLPGLLDAPLMTVRREENRSLGGARMTEPATSESTPGRKGCPKRCSHCLRAGSRSRLEGSPAARRSRASAMAFGSFSMAAIARWRSPMRAHLSQWSTITAPVSGKPTARASVAHPASSQRESLLRVDPVEQGLRGVLGLHVLQRGDHRRGEEPLVLFAALVDQRLGRRVGDEVAQHVDQVLGRDREGHGAGQGVERPRADGEARQTQRPPERRDRRLAALEAPDDLDGHGAGRVRRPFVDDVGQPRHQGGVVAHLGDPVLVLGEDGVHEPAVAAARDLDQQVCRLGVVERDQAGGRDRALALLARQPGRDLHRTAAAGARPRAATR